jgi:hypothetical protein
MGERVITTEQAEALVEQLTAEAAAEALAAEMASIQRARVLRQSEIVLGVCGAFFLACLFFVLCLSLGVVTL